MASIVKMSIDYFADPTKGRPVANGNIYVGIVDLDPEIPANQKQISVIQEDGTTVEVSQPLSLSAGGIPVYNGSPVTIVVVDGNYSLKVNDKHGAQVYYIPTSSAIGDVEVVAVLETIQELRDYSTQTSVGAFYVLGYSVKGDGGGGPVRYFVEGEPAGTYTDNGGSVIIPTGGDGSAAYLMPEDALVTPEMFGANADGTDDSSYIQAAYDSGFSVTGSGSEYSIATTITLTDISEILPIKLKVITAHIAIAVSVSITTAIDFLVNGVEIDCNNLANVGIYTLNTHTSDVTAVYKHIKISNVKRIVSFTKGDGIHWQGFADLVAMYDINIDTVTLGTGAGIVGVIGVTGIAITDGTSGEPAVIKIGKHVIKNITTEDLTYDNDQDGIKILSSLSGGDPFIPQVVSINAGNYYNCFGRSIKLQSTSATVSNCLFERDTFWTTDEGVVEIDFQFGGGKVDRCVFKYTGGTPGNEVIKSTARFANDLISLQVSNIKIKNNVKINRIVRPTADITVGSVKNMGVNLLNVTADLCDYMVHFGNSDSTDLIYNEITSCSANCATAAVRLSDVVAHINLKGFTNTGTSVPGLLVDATATGTLSATACLGIDENYVYGNEIGSMAKTLSVVVADAATVILDEAGYLNRSLMFFKTDGPRTEYAIGAIDTTAIASIAIGSNMTFNTQGNAGTINIFVDSGAINIENLSGTSRTVMMISMLPKT